MIGLLALLDVKRWCGVGGASGMVAGQASKTLDRYLEESRSTK
jgi:hypothetical protein